MNRPGPLAPVCFTYFPDSLGRNTPMLRRVRPIACVRLDRDIRRSRKLNRRIPGIGHLVGWQSSHSIGCCFENRSTFDWGFFTYWKIAELRLALTAVFARWAARQRLFR